MPIASRNTPGATAVRPMKRAGASRLRRGVLMVCLVCAAASIGPVLWWVAGTPQRHLVSHLQSRLETSETRRIPGVLRALLSMGDVGLRAVVSAVGSPRAAVALQAQLVLGDALSSWRAGAREQSNMATLQGRQRVLVGALADRVKGFGPNARMFASKIALEVLNASSDAVDARVVADCEEILAVAGLPHRGLGVAKRVNDVPVDSVDRVNGELLNPAAVWTQLPDVPGGGIDMPHSQSAGVQGSPVVQTPQEPANLAPERPPVSAALPIYGRRTFEGQWRAPHADPQEWSRQGEHRPNPPRHDDVAAHRPPPIPEHVPETGPGGRDRASRFSTMREAMGALHDESLAQQAADELTWRWQLNDVEVAIARLATDPRASVRRELIEKLYSVAGIDPRPWLLLLAQDEDDHTRLVALTMMATSGDPELLQRARELAARDPHPRIAAIADRLDGHQTERR